MRAFWRWVTVLLLCLPVAARAACGLTRVATVPMRDVDRQFLVDVAMNDKPVTLRIVARVRAVLLALWLPLASCAGQCGLTRVAVVPIEVANHQFVVDAAIDGKPARLLLDTGSTASFLSFKGMRRLGLSGVASPVEISGLGGSSPTRRLELDSFQLGTLHARHFTMLGLDIGGGAWPLDGLLGADILSQYDLDIDVVARRLIFYEPHGSCASPPVVLGGEATTAALLPTPATAPPSNVTRADFAQGWTFSPRVTVSIGGRSFRALLDSGAEFSAMFRTTALSLGMRREPTTLVHRVGGIGPKLVAAFATTLPQLDVGSLRLTNVPMLVVDQPSPGVADLIIGNDFMQLVHLWISHSSNTVVFQYPPVPSP